jgi:hypothetical protein
MKQRSLYWHAAHCREGYPAGVLNIITLLTKDEPGHVSIVCTPPPCSCLLTERKKNRENILQKFFVKEERERGIPSQAPFILSRIFEKLA